MKNAILFTGAAARISQEVALFDKLREIKDFNPTIEDTFITGFSSGAINVLALNVCFGDKNPKNWDEYYKRHFLFDMKNEDVYVRNDKILPIYDTTPLRKTLERFIDNCDFKYLKDLPFYSNILTFSLQKLMTCWGTSRDEDEYYLNVIDMLMASTAIPALFPLQEVGRKEGENVSFPTGKFSDGGTLGTFKRFKSNLRQYYRQNKRERFENMYIISPMREPDNEEMISEDLKSLANSNETEGNTISDFIKNHSYNTFIKFLKKLEKFRVGCFLNNKPIADNIYVCIPRFETNFNILDFSNQELQYNTTCKWVDENPKDFAVPLSEYLERKGV